MRVLVNGLSATSLSGRHVLMGHLRQLAEWSVSMHEFVVLYHAGNRELVCDLPPNVTWREAPARVRAWPGRMAWEVLSLERVANDVAADLLFTPTGTTVPGFRKPQVTLAQNPWCLASGLKRTAMEQVKAALQRAAYRRAVQRADLLVYNSEWIRDAYRRNARGAIERQSVIAYQGLDADTFEAAAQCSTARDPLEILAVSVMAPWKNVETLVAAVGLVRRKGVAATLNLVGPWADTQYEAAIRQQIQSLGLGGAVRIRGKVSRDDLHGAYARARVFCLLSRCESFGIPAVEAQAFGTPGVVATGCAMPEVCGGGCVAVSPDDPQAAAAELEKLLVDEVHWQAKSIAARANAQRFQWRECSRPLMRMFELC